VQEYGERVELDFFETNVV